MNKVIDNFLNQNINYYSYSLLKSILAFSLLLTIIFNDFQIIYMEDFIKIGEYAKVSTSAFKIISIIILVLTIIGFLPRLTGVLHFAVTYLFFKTCPFIDGGDQLSSNLTFFILPLSLFDSNLNHWKNKNNSFNGSYSKPFFIFTSLIICIQISIVYLHSSIDKLKVPEWQDGTAIWYWFTHESFGASYFILDFLKFVLSNSYVIFSLNWSVIIIELLVAMMLFVPKENMLPRVLFYLALVLHIGVILVHGIFTFSLVMIGSLIFYFKINPKFIWRLK